MPIVSWEQAQNLISSHPKEYPYLSTGFTSNRQKAISLFVVAIIIAACTWGSIAMVNAYGSEMYPLLAITLSPAAVALVFFIEDLIFWVRVYLEKKSEKSEDLHVETPIFNKLLKQEKEWLSKAIKRKENFEKAQANLTIQNWEQAKSLVKSTDEEVPSHRVIRSLYYPYIHEGVKGKTAEAVGLLFCSLLFIWATVGMSFETDYYVRNVGTISLAVISATFLGLAIYYVRQSLQLYREKKLKDKPLHELPILNTLVAKDREHLKRALEHYQKYQPCLDRL